MDFNLTFKFILAFVIGAVIGLEREVNEKRNLSAGSKKNAILGLRTFSLAASLGAMVGVFSFNFPFIAIIISAAFLSLTLAFYILDSISSKDYGITTEIALIYSFILGLLITLETIPIQLTLAITVVLIFLLSRKETIKSMLEDISRSEINAFISFAIIALVILPFLPNQSYTLSNIPNLANYIENLGVNFNRIINVELVNPFKLWVIVALITGVDLVGYILERTIGQKRGWILTSMAGGFISSTAVTQSLAAESRKSKSVNHLISAAILSNLISFVQIAILIGSLNLIFLTKLMPTLLGMVASALVISLYFLRIKEKNGTKIEEVKKIKTKIINLGSALKFVAIFLFISLTSKIALVILGNSGFLITTILGAIVGLDAVMINTAQITGNTIDFRLGIIAFIIANVVNLTAKSIYSFLQGNREFAAKFSLSVGIVMLSSLIGLLFS